VRAVAGGERRGRRDLEWRGVVAAGLGAVLFVPFVSGDVWLGPAVYAALLVIFSALGAITLRLSVRFVALLVATLLWLPGVLYGLGMFPPVGLVMAIAAVMTAWGAVRAARGLRSVPRPLA
jgi:hypothetical protein